MNLLAGAVRAAERASLPDAAMLAIVGWLARHNARRLARISPDEEARFVADTANDPIGLGDAGGAIPAHDGLPHEFFGLVLGPQYNLSCCRYPGATTSLAEAEVLALDETIEHAALRDGQRILELGAGWGCLALRLAEQYPRSRIVCVATGQAQRRYIEARARERILPNLTVAPYAINAFEAPERFDRVVSIELFGQIANWRALLSRVSDWLEPDGRLFLHVFAHRSRSYRFDASDPNDWLAQHFFASQWIPAIDLPHRFADVFSVEQEWRWPGVDYRRTALDWLANFDSNRARIDELMGEAYGADAALWSWRWRTFFLTAAGFFGYAGGAEWGVGRYRLALSRP